jgi:hypothetical protein
VRLLATGAGLLVAIAAREARTRTPLVPLRIFRRKTLTAANAVQLFMIAGYFGQQFLIALYLQRVIHGPLRRASGPARWDLTGRRRPRPAGPQPRPRVVSHRCASGSRPARRRRRAVDARTHDAMASVSGLSRSAPPVSSLGSPVWTWWTMGCRSPARQRNTMSPSYDSSGGSHRAGLVGLTSVRRRPRRDVRHPDGARHRRLPHRTR